jgi:hypothetical protein
MLGVLHEPKLIDPPSEREGHTAHRGQVPQAEHGGGVVGPRFVDPDVRAHGGDAAVAGLVRDGAVGGAAQVGISDEPRTQGVGAVRDERGPTINGRGEVLCVNSQMTVPFFGQNLNVITDTGMLREFLGRDQPQAAPQPQPAPQPQAPSAAASAPAAVSTPVEPATRVSAQSAPTDAGTPAASGALIGWIAAGSVIGGAVVGGLRPSSPPPPSSCGWGARRGDTGTRPGIGQLGGGRVPDTPFGAPPAASRRTRPRGLPACGRPPAIRDGYTPYGEGKSMAVRKTSALPWPPEPVVGLVATTAPPPLCNRRTPALAK